MNIINKNSMNKISMYYLCTDYDIIDIKLLEIDNDDIMYYRLIKYLEIYNNMFEDNLDLHESSKYLKKYKGFIYIRMFI